MLFRSDHFSVKFHGQRGADNGVVIRYGKNLLDLVSEEDSGDLYTACVPFFKSQDGTVTICEKVTSEGWSANHDLVTVMDMGQYFTAPENAAEDWHPTTTAMSEKAYQLMERNAVYLVAQNLKVKFAILSQYSEFEFLESLERINLCDYVTVVHPILGVDVKIKCVETVWDGPNDRYYSVELGEPTKSLSATLTSGLTEDIKEVKGEIKDAKSSLQFAIEHATDLITGGTGGHVVLGRNANGEPNEIFIMDTADVSTAANVLRLNMNGIGFSSTGVNGEYRSAWTLDGAFVADFITAGTLSAVRIKAGILQDTQGTNFWNMETGEFQLTSGASVKNGNSTSTLASYVDGIADDAVSDYNSTLNQTAVYNKLTNNGSLQGLYMQNGNLYINGSYIHSGIIDADLIKTGKIQATGSDNYIDLDTGAMQLSVSATVKNGNSTSTVANYVSGVASDAISDYDDDLDQEEIYDRLTNSSANEGIYLSGGHLYLNASKINTGTLSASRISGGTLVSNDQGENFSLNLATGALTMKSGSIELGSSTGTYYFKVATTGALQWNSSYSSMSNTGVLTIKSGAFQLGYNSTADAYNILLNSNGLKLGYDATNSAYNFSVSSAGAVTIKNGSIELGTVNSDHSARYFKVSTGGVVSWDGTYSSMSNTGILHSYYSNGYKAYQLSQGKFNLYSSSVEDELIGGLSGQTYTVNGTAKHCFNIYADTDHPLVLGHTSNDGANANWQYWIDQNNSHHVKAESWELYHINSQSVRTTFASISNAIWTFYGSTYNLTANSAINLTSAALTFKDGDNHTWFDISNAVWQLGTSTSGRIRYNSDGVGILMGTNNYTVNINSSGYINCAGTTFYVSAGGNALYVGQNGLMYNGYRVLTTQDL